MKIKQYKQAGSAYFYCETAARAVGELRLHLISGLMIVMIGFMFFQVVILKAAESQKNPYLDDQVSLEDVMKNYHKHVNDTFNLYIKKMLTENQKNPDDPNGKAPQTNNPEMDCLKNNANYSTYCLAVRLLGDDKTAKDQGYLSYKKALLARRDQIFDTAKEKDLYQKFIEATSCAGKSPTSCDAEKVNASTQNIYQTQKLLEISDRTRAIDHEITLSKDVLDKTLAAYDQLRMAFPMHLAYRKIFNQLVDYRSKLVELRDQTDDFPAHFVDVATLKCT